jgi:hypothetical protein
MSNTALAGAARHLAAELVEFASMLEAPGKAEGRITHRIRKAGNVARRRRIKTKEMTWKTTRSVPRFLYVPLPRWRPPPSVHRQALPRDLFTNCFSLFHHHSLFHFVHKLLHFVSPGPVIRQLSAGRTTNALVSPSWPPGSIAARPG